MTNTDQIEATLATAKRLRAYTGNVYCIEAARFDRQMAKLRRTLTPEQYCQFMLRLRLQVTERVRHG